MKRKMSAATLVALEVFVLGHSVSSQGVFSVADFDDGLDCAELNGAVPP